MAAEQSERLVSIANEFCVIENRDGFWPYTSINYFCDGIWVAGVRVERHLQYWYIRNLIVKLEYRRRGFASKLMQKVVKLFGDEQLKLLAYPSIERNKPAIVIDKLCVFYASFGFQIEEHYAMNEGTGYSMVRLANIKGK